MEKIKCKECGKDINKKAEICPNCGCRVKSNTLKFIFICLVVITFIVGIYFSFIFVKHKIYENKKIEEQKVMQEEAEKLKKILNSYIGKYIVKYDKELFKKDHPLFELKEEFTIDDQCYKKEVDGMVQEGDIVDNCITMENSKFIPYIHISGNGYVIYKDSSKDIFYLALRNLISKNNSQDASKETLKEMELYSYYVCFEGDSNNLKQIDCPKKIFENRMPNDTLDSKYNFEIIKSN